MIISVYARYGEGRFKTLQFFGEIKYCLCTKYSSKLFTESSLNDNCKLFKC